MAVAVQNPCGGMLADVLNSADWRVSEVFVNLWGCDELWHGLREIPSMKRGVPWLESLFRKASTESSRRRELVGDRFYLVWLIWPIDEAPDNSRPLDSFTDLAIRYEERGPPVSRAKTERRAAKMIRELRRLGYRVEPRRTKQALRCEREIFDHGSRGFESECKPRSCCRGI